jgi:hypothetical protein
MWNPVSLDIHVFIYFLFFIFFGAVGYCAVIGIFLLGVPRPSSITGAAISVGESSVNLLVGMHLDCNVVDR